MDCSCPRDQLCPRCFDLALSWHVGTARSRGIRWAERVARLAPRKLELDWPAHEGRAAAIAARLVAKLDRDPRVLEVLAAACAEYAARRWGQIRNGEGMRV